MNMNDLTKIAIGVLVLVVIFIIVPVIGESIDNAITIGPASNWNASVNADIPTGYGTWTTLAALLVVAALGIIVAVLISVFRGIRGSD